MHSFLTSVVSFLLIIAGAVAQQQPAAAQREAMELPFLASAAKELDAFATLAFKNSFPRRARDVWIELLAEYDGDDNVAREALGFVRVGTAWQPKPNFEYPKTDEPNPGSAKMLEVRWAGLAKKVGDGHRELAEQLAAAGKEERAKYHFQRSLRYQPADAKAQVGLGAKTVEGITGTELDLVLLRRSRLIDREITKQTDEAYKVEPADIKDERIDKAGVTYSAFKSEHFVVLGDWEPDVLEDAARWAERSLAFCKVAFAGYEPWKTEPILTTRFAFFKTRKVWSDVVTANQSSISDVDFILKNTSATGIGKGKNGIHLCGIEAAGTVFDFAVRKVAHDYSRLGRDALTEGIGHAVVGLFFGRNLIVSVAQQKPEGTATKKDYSKYDLPDIETWKELARELAFDKATAPAAHLPLISAAKFTHEERLKAWSFCDYLLRRDPTLMLELDKTSAKSRNDFDVMAAFQEATKLSLRGLEDDWRHFYIDDSPALSAIRNKVTPMQSVSKDAPVWVEELNTLRRRYGSKEVVWSAELSAPCKQHVEYLKQNKSERGPDNERTQEPDKKGFANTGRLFAQTAVTTTKDKDPKKAMESWILMPGYRDVLLDHGLDMVGAYADGPICVFDVLRGRAAKSFNETVPFPFNNVEKDGKHFYKETVPAAIDVDLIGPELRAVLSKHKLGKAKQVGFPLTMHLFQAGTNDVQCAVTAGGEDVEGILFSSTEGSRRIAAPGLWVFLPLQPLRKGVEILVTWTVKGRTEKPVMFFAS